MTMPISEFYSDPKSGLNRVAKVSASLSGTAYIVEMFEGETLIDSRIITDHTLEYAEDCAENWALGVINPTIMIEDQKWTLPVEYDTNGDAIVLLNDELIAHLDVKSGDSIKWIDDKDGTWSIEKVKDNVG